MQAEPRVAGLIALAYQRGWIASEGLASLRRAVDGAAAAGRIVEARALILECGVLDDGQLVILEAELDAPPTSEARAPTRAPDLAIGSTLGEFRITGVLGAGGMGVVYSAIHTRLRQTVALKVVQPHFLAQPQARARFEREVQAVGRLQHENVVRILGVGCESGLPFYAMELLPGRALADLLERGALEPAQAAQIALGVARGLAHAHARGVVHRDIKPSNILVVNEDSGPRAVIVDFGLARQIDASTLTLTAQVMGTPVYMSPEQASGRVAEAGAPSDVYSLGATLYEMLAGRALFVSQNPVDLIRRILSEEPDRLAKVAPGAPPALATIVERALEKEPAARYASAAAMASDLQAFLEGARIAARPVGAIGRLRRRARRHRAVTATIGGALIVLLFMLGVAIANKIADYERALLAETNERNARLEAVRQRDSARRRASAQDLVMQAVHLIEVGAESGAVMERFRAAENEDPTYHGVFQQRGRALHESGNLEQAIVDLDHALKLEPADAISLYHRYRAGDALGRDAQAQTDLALLASMIGGGELSAWARGRAARRLAFTRFEPRARLADLERARDELDIALTLAPKFALAYVDRARVQLELDDPVRAKSDIDLALALEPELPSALREAGVLASIFEEHDAAMAHFARALVNAPRDAAAAVERARTELNIGAIRMAGADIEYALKIREDCDALTLAVDIYLEAGDMESATRAAARALELAAEHPDAIAAACKVAQARGDDTRVKELSDHLIASAPADWRGWLYSGQLAKARAVAALWSELGARMGSYIESLAEVALAEAAFAAGDSAAAFAHCQQAHRVGYHPSDHHFLEVRMHIAAGDLAAARAVLKPMLASRAHAIDAVLSHAALTRAESGDDRALEILRDGLARCAGAWRIARAIATSDESARALLGPTPAALDAEFAAIESLLDSKEHALALDRARQLATAAPESWRAQLYETRARFALDEFDQALAACTRAVHRGFDQAEVFHWRARLHRRLDQHDAAIADLSRAIALEPTPELLDERAMAYKTIRQIGQALADLDRAVTMAPDHRILRLHRANLLQDMGELERALNDYDHGIALGQEEGRLRLGRGFCLAAMERLDEALADLVSFRDANPDYKPMELLDRNIDELQQRIESRR